jgi:hypothetical protein
VIGLPAPEHDVGRAEANMNGACERRFANDSDASADAKTESREAQSQRRIGVNGGDRGVIAGAQMEERKHVSVVANHSHCRAGNSAKR